MEQWLRRAWKWLAQATDQHSARLVWLTVATLVIFTVIAARFTAANRSGFSSVPGWSATSTSNGKVGDIVDFGVQFETFPDEPITLQSASFDRPLPAHVHLLHTAIMLLSDGCCSFVGASDWPPHAQQGAFRLHPVAGLTLAPHTFATFVYAVRLDTPGTYILGPITLHGATPTIPGLGLLSVPVSGTYRQYGVLCYSGQRDCDQALQSLPV
jgi:hypothetical protein